jgi:hypothetical protein
MIQVSLEYTEDRLDSFELTNPVYTNEIVILSAVPSTDLFQTAIGLMSVFSFKVILALIAITILSMVIASIIFGMLEPAELVEHDNVQHRIHIFYSTSWHLLWYLAGHGDNVKTLANSFKGRCIILPLSIASIVFLNTYNSCLCSKLFVLRSHRLIDSFTDLIETVESGNIRLILWKGGALESDIKSADDNDGVQIYNKMRKALLQFEPLYVNEESDFNDTFNEYISTGQALFVGHSDGAFALAALEREDIVTTTVSDMAAVFVGFIFRKGHPLVHTFNKAITKVQLHLNSIQQQYWLRLSNDGRRHTKQPSQLPQLNVEHFLGPIILLLLGLLVAVLSHFGEHVYRYAYPVYANSNPSFLVWQ